MRGGWLDISVCSGAAPKVSQLAVRNGEDRENEGDLPKRKEERKAVVAKSERGNKCK